MPKPQIAPVTVATLLLATPSVIAGPLHDPVEDGDLARPQAQMAESPLCLTRVGMLDHLERNYAGINLLFSAKDHATDNAYEIWVQPNDRWFLIVQDIFSDGNGTCILDAGNDAKLMKSGLVSPTMIRRMERERDQMADTSSR